LLDLALEVAMNARARAHAARGRDGRHRAAPRLVGLLRPGKDEYDLYDLNLAAPWRASSTRSSASRSRRSSPASAG